MSPDGTGLAEALLGLDGFRVLGVDDLDGEVVVLIETRAERVGCFGCGMVAEAQDRLVVEIRDLACFGRPARLRWAKRRWRCREPLCDAKTWTEESAHVSPRSVLTRRAGADACRRVGEEALPVSRLAKELGVSWSTVMDEHGTPLVEDPARVGPRRPARPRRDLVPQGHACAPDPAGDRTGRPEAPSDDRPDRGQFTGRLERDQETPASQVRGVKPEPLTLLTGQFEANDAGVHYHPRIREAVHPSADGLDERLPLLVGEVVDHTAAVVLPGLRIGRGVVQDLIRGVGPDVQLIAFVLALDGHLRLRRHPGTSFLRRDLSVRGRRPALAHERPSLAVPARPATTRTYLLFPLTDYHPSSNTTNDHFSINPLQRANYLSQYPQSGEHDCNETLPGVSAPAAWMRMMGSDSVAYHRQTIVDRADDHAGQALAYYASRGETPLRWGGSGAKRLGLVGPVTDAQYEAIYGPGGACDPTTGKRLVRTLRPGMELVISAHKSVAELGVLGRAEDMHEIMDAERDATVAYLDDLTQRMGGRRGRSRTASATSGLIYAHARHATSRAGDPCPHDHLLLANVIDMRDRRGGYKAPDTTLWREHLHAATMVGRMAGARPSSWATPSSPTTARPGAWATGPSRGSPRRRSRSIRSVLRRSTPRGRARVHELSGPQHRRPGDPQGQAPHAGL